MNKTALTADRPLKVKVGKTTDGKTTLAFSDGQRVVISSKFLPTHSKEGDLVYLDLLNVEQYNQTKQEIAREVLKEILEPENGKDGEQE